MSHKIAIAVYFLMRQQIIGTFLQIADIDFLCRTWCMPRQFRLHDRPFWYSCTWLMINHPAICTFWTTMITRIVKAGPLKKRTQSYEKWHLMCHLVSMIHSRVVITDNRLTDSLIYLLSNLILVGDATRFPLLSCKCNTMRRRALVLHLLSRISILSTYRNMRKGLCWLTYNWGNSV